MEGLGDLPGGLFEGVAEAVSADGSVVVGWSYSTEWEAFRWTTATGIVGLGRLQGGSWAYGVSADGEVVVGHDSSAGAFVWDPGHGMRNVQDLLTTTYPGLIPAGWALSLAADVSADGLTVVGTGINPSGDSEAWIADLPCCEVLPCCPSDLDCDGQTDITDLGLLLSRFGSCPADPDFWPRANIDRWGCVDLADLTRLLGAFGTACE